MSHRLQRPFGWLAAAALAAVALVPMPASAAAPPVTWKVNVGAQTTDMGVQANGFFNKNITANVGDTVQWSWTADEIHTVTFLPPGMKEPDLFSVQGGQLVPTQFIAPSGNGVWPDPDPSVIASSGVFGFIPGLKTFSLMFTTPGTYSYICLVHDGMAGTITVNPANTPYPATQDAYNNAAFAQQSMLLGLGRSLFGQGQAAAAPNAEAAGIGEVLSGASSTLAVLRFVPDKRVVHAGDTVTWTNQDPETPHTVTLPPSAAPANPLASYNNSSNVSCTATECDATINSPSDVVNSGFLANDPLFQKSNTFKAKFINPGTYTYVCAIHAPLGMTGTIVVLP